jgi:hypothetical protein
MSKIKIKQISSDGATEGAVLTADGSGGNTWGQPVLGLPDDGSFTDARYEGGKSPAVGLTATTKVATAIDSINEVLGLLLPDAPTAIGGQTLSLATASTSALAASGFTTNSLAGAPAAGAVVTRVTATTINSNTIANVGDGAAGILTAYAQGAELSGENLTFTDTIGQTKTSGVLRVSNNTWGGTSGGSAAPNGFFQKFDTNLTGATAAQGYNTFQIKHSISGDTTTLALVRDDLTATPVTSSVTIAENTKVVKTTSGVDHYDVGSILNVSGSITNLAGETYSSGTIISMTSPAGSARNFTAGQGGLSATLTHHMSAFALTNQTFTIGSSYKSTSGKITVAGTNPNGTGTGATHSTNLLVSSGSTGVNEPNITGPATTSRVYLTSGTGDTPASLTNSAWDSEQDLSTAGYLHEAVIAGGVLRKDVTNYSTGYLPAGGPDYSTKDATQYITWKFALGSKSSVAVSITGTYAGMWVALPGVSDDSGISPNAEGGAWWNAFTLYNGAGVPGRTGQNAGCANGAAATGTTGTTNITFGTQSSSNSTNNEVIIRLKLTGSQSITAISVA